MEKEGMRVGSKIHDNSRLNTIEDTIYPKQVTKVQNWFKMHYSVVSFSAHSAIIITNSSIKKRGLLP